MARCGHRCGSAAALGNESGQIAGTDLGDVISVGDLVECIAIQTYSHPAVEDRNRGRNGSAGSYDVLDLGSHAKVLRARQAVTDDGGLERHDRCS